MLLKKTILGVVLLLSLLPAISASAQNTDVITSIKPLQLLVQEITGDSVGVVVRGAASAHDYSLRPSDLKTMSQAKILFWIGPSMESFLAKVIEKFPDLKIVTLLNTPALDLHQGHQHAEQHALSSADHDATHIDSHIWLSPKNGLKLAEEINQQLSIIQPDQKATYDANFKNFKQRLQHQLIQSKQALAPLKQVGFISYHNAWEYWVDYFELSQLDVVTRSPEQKPGAKQQYQIRQHFVQGRSTCLLLEPGINPRQVHSLTKGLDINTQTTDPMAVNASSYIDWVKQTTGHFVTCLKKM